MSIVFLHYGHGIHLHVHYCNARHDDILHDKPFLEGKPYSLFLADNIPYNKN
jgi:hypothetical protein